LKNKFKACCPALMLGLGLASSVPLYGDEGRHERSGFSFFGVGIAHSDYEESTVFSDIRVQSDASGNQTSQRSGAYININPEWGFYLSTNSFFGTDSLSESWDVNGVFVQRNKFSLKRSEIQLLFSHEFSDDRHYFLFGGGNIEKSFTRFDYEFPEQNESGVDINKNPGNITEDSSQLVAYVGYEYNEFFVGDSSGLKCQLQALLGMPIYSETLNNGVGDVTLNSSFDGYIFRLVPSIGWQFNESLLLALTTDYIINRRDEDRTTVGSGDAILPKSHFWSAFSSVAVYWSF